MKRWREGRAERAVKRASDQHGDQITDQLIAAIEAVEDEKKRAFLTEALLAGDVEFRLSEEFVGAVVFVGGVPVLEHRLNGSD